MSEGNNSQSTFMPVVGDDDQQLRCWGLTQGVQGDYLDEPAQLHGAATPALAEFFVSEENDIIHRQSLKWNHRLALCQHGKFWCPLWMSFGN